MFVASELATSGSVIANAERISPSSSGISQRSLLLVACRTGAAPPCCRCRAPSSCRPRRRSASGRASRRAARSRCWRGPAPCSSSGRNMFHSPASRAFAFSSSMTAGWWCGSPDSRSCCVVDRLGRVDVLVHERARRSLNSSSARSARSPSISPRWRQGLRIIADEPRRRQLPRGRRRLRGARRRQAPGDGRARCRPRRCSHARGGRALDASRGEPAFVFELGGQTLAFVVEGLGTKSMIARAVLEQSGVNRFADVAYDTVAAIAQRPLLRRRAAAGRERLLRDRLLGVVRASASAPRRCSRAGAAACARRGLRRGAAASRRRCRGCSPSDEIELAGAAVGAVPAGRAPILGEAPAARAMRSCSSPRSGLHANGASLARLLADAAARRLRDAAAPTARRFGEALLAPSRDVRAARAPRCSKRGRPSSATSEPRHRPRPAEADAPAARADLPDRAPAAGAAGARVPRRARRARRRGRRTRRSTWAAASRSTARPGGGGGGRRRGRGRARARARSSRDASRRVPGRWSSSRSASATRARSSSSPHQLNPQARRSASVQSVGKSLALDVARVRRRRPRARHRAPSGAATACPLDGCDLNASPGADRVPPASRHCSPATAGDLDVAGPRMAPELPGSRRTCPSTEER